MKYLFIQASRRGKCFSGHSEELCNIPKLDSWHPPVFLPHQVASAGSISCPAARINVSR